MNVAEDPEKCSKRNTAIVVGIVLTGGLLPLMLYWVFCGSVPAITPVKARRLLQAPKSEAMLIDVRPLQDFNEKHIDGAQSWPLEDILATEYPNEVPGQFKTKTLLIICDGRMRSSFASKHLVGISVENVANVRGGYRSGSAALVGRREACLRDSGRCPVRLGRCHFAIRQSISS